MWDDVVTGVALWLSACVLAGLVLAVWLARRPVGWWDSADLPSWLRSEPELTGQAEPDGPDAPGLAGAGPRR